MNSLRDALLKGGVVTKDDIAKVEKEKEAEKRAARRKAEEDEAKRAIGKNRLGVPPRYLSWANRMPLNVESICCLCGQDGLTRWDIAKQFHKLIREEQDKKELNFFQIMEKQREMAREIGKKGSLLRPFHPTTHDRFSLQLLAKFKDKQLNMCQACFRHEHPFVAKLEDEARLAAAKNVPTPKDLENTMTLGLLIGEVLDEELKEDKKKS